MSLRGTLANFSEQLIFAILRQRLQLVLQVLGVEANLSFPVRILQDQSAGLILEPLHVLGDELLEDPVAVVRHLLQRLILQLLDLSTHHLESVLPQQLELRVEAVV